MKRLFVVSLFIFLFFCFFSCHSKYQNNQDRTDSSNRGDIVNSANNIPEVRNDTKAEPVAEYKEKTDNPLNNWYFSVRLYETKKTFNYLMKLQFEEVRGEDTLRLPNLGNLPKPAIQKGKDKYSCIIGFMDNENKFREYKLVHVENGNNLKVTTLKHYSVATFEQ